MDPELDTETVEGSSSATPKKTGEGAAQVKQKSASKDKDASANKRRCVSTACIACRKRKSKCDGNLPKCAACASVYLTECEYAPHTDHLRKGVYKKDVDNLKTRNSTLQILIQALLNYEEEDAFELVRQIRSCDNLEDLAQVVENKEKGIMDTPDSPIYGNDPGDIPRFEAELSSKMGDIVIDGAMKFIGGTSNLIWFGDDEMNSPQPSKSNNGRVAVKPNEEAVLSWTTVTQDKDLILHFMNMYFCWHYTYFTTLSKELFYRDFLTGTRSQYCSPLLVNVMLALGCHFSSKPAARADPDDSSTTGDHYFAEARRLLHKDDEFVIPKLCTVQGLALMSVREAGCGRESKGWVYSGMSFRMALDMGLNVDVEPISDVYKISDEEIDARRITFWGCFLFDKCWSNYLGRQPQLLLANINVRKPEVFAAEDSELWCPYTDAGIVHANTQPARTRAVSLQIFKLTELSSDLLSFFYHPQNLDKPSSKQNELKKLSDIHTRLEAWKKDLPLELDAKDGQMPQVLLMHMFYQLLYIHLYRPFLKYTKSTSPLPSHVSPRKFCTQAASAISKLFRLYKRTHGLRQICNIAIYIAHSACTIHLLNLPDKNARRDIIHGMKQLEEIGECWVIARRTLRILAVCADKWKITLPDEVQASLARASQRWTSTEPASDSKTPEALPTTAQQIQSRSPSDTVVQSAPQQWQQTQMPQTETHVHFPTQTSTSTSQPRLASLPAIMPDDRQPSAAVIAAAPDLEIQRNANRPKMSIVLTKAQQDAWNAHQSRMRHLTSGEVRTPNETPSTAASLFGGIDSLIEESQDWWYHDQSQIAAGFDNWNTPPAADWSGVGGSLTMNMNNDAGIYTGSSPGSDSLENGQIVSNGVNLHLSSTPSNMNAYMPISYPQQHQGMQRLRQSQQAIARTMDDHGLRDKPSTAAGTQKRRMEFDEDMTF